MSDKDAAKRRRQARNRQERMNRQKRTEGAKKVGSARPPARRSASTTRTRTAAAAGRDGRPSRAANPAPASGGLLGKLFPPRPAPAAATTKGEQGEERPARPARVPQPKESIVLEVEVEEGGLRGQVLRRMAQPGGRATTVALILGVVVTVMLFVVPLTPHYVFPAVEAGDGGYAEMVVSAQPGTEAEREERVDDLIDRDPVALGTQRLTDVWSPVVVAGFASVLLLVVATAFRSLDRPTRSRTLMISAFGLVAIMMVLNQVVLPMVAALAYGSYQSRKADRLAAASGDL